MNVLSWKMIPIFFWILVLMYLWLNRVVHTLYRSFLCFNCMKQFQNLSRFEWLVRVCCGLNSDVKATRSHRCTANASRTDIVGRKSCFLFLREETARTHSYACTIDKSSAVHQRHDKICFFYFCRSLSCLAFFQDGSLRDQN